MTEITVTGTERETIVGVKIEIRIADSEIPPTITVDHDGMIIVHHGCREEEGVLIEQVIDWISKMTRMIEIVMTVEVTEGLIVAREVVEGVEGLEAHAGDVEEVE